MYVADVVAVANARTGGDHEDFRVVSVAHQLCTTHRSAARSALAFVLKAGESAFSTRAKRELLAGYPGDQIVLASSAQVLHMREKII